MKADKEGPPEFQELRKKAEDIVGQIPDEGIGRVSPAEIRKLIHELNVHQIELEMQNAELRRAQVELSESRDQYANLYNTAPVGYFTLNKEGVILRVNPNGCALLGKERAQLNSQPFTVSVMKEDWEAFFSHIRKVFTRSLKDTCEVPIGQTWPMVSRPIGKRAREGFPGAAHPMPISCFGHYGTQGGGTGPVQVAR